MDGESPVIEDPDCSLLTPEDETTSESAPEGAPPRRSTRKRIRSVSPKQCRMVNKSVKLSENSSLKDIKNYYLDRKIKRLNPSLETIFEEPQIVNDQPVVMSSRKFKRAIKFNSIIANTKNDPKTKKRKLKAKSLRIKKPKKVPLKLLMDKLKEVDD